jgi:2,4-dienoyl-CoA reductase-like NADH-dependent reductase (Old Yellow Enzyme family)
MLNLNFIYCSPETLKSDLCLQYYSVPPNKSITLKTESPFLLCQYSATDGFANDWHLVHLGSRASGGAGLIIQEATSVSQKAEFSGRFRALEDEQIEMQQINRFIGQNSVPGIQLAHAGRKASAAIPWEGGKKLDRSWGLETVAPSAIGFHDDETPIALDKAGIQVISDFKSAKKIREGWFSSNGNSWRMVIYS